MSKKTKLKKDRERRLRAQREMSASRLERRKPSTPRAPHHAGVRPGVPARQAGPDAPGGQSRFLNERAQRWILWANGTRGEPSGDDVRDLVNSGALAEYKNDSREAGQEMAYEALETADRERSQHLALQALHFDDACADARRVLADIEATSHIDRVGRLKKALLDEETRIADVLEEFDGRLSEAVEAMPYLRARFDLACALWSADRRPRGRTHFEKMFAQDAEDAVGARYPLIMARLHDGDHAGARELLDDPKTERAELLVRWARVLEKVLAGELEEAEALYLELREGREGEANSLATPPPADFAYPGFFRDELMEYAALCLRMLHWAWHAHPESSAWLKERADSETSAEPGADVAVAAESGDAPDDASE